MENQINLIIEGFKNQETWSQLVMPGLTFLAILIALFGERIWRWKDRPKLGIHYNPNHNRCMRRAIISTDFIQDDGQHLDVERIYFRLRIRNEGKVARNIKAKIDVFDADAMPASRFEPSLLRWIDGANINDLSPGEDNYINLLSQVISHDDVNNKIRIEISDFIPRGIAWDRPLVPWIIRVTIYGENLYKTVTKSWQIIPQKEIDQSVELKKVDNPKY